MLIALIYLFKRLCSHWWYCYCGNYPAACEPRRDITILLFANCNNGGYAVTDYALRGCAAP